MIQVPCASLPEPARVVDVDVVVEGAVVVGGAVVAVGTVAGTVVVDTSDGGGGRSVIGGRVGAGDVVGSGGGGSLATCGAGAGAAVVGRTPTGAGSIGGRVSSLLSAGTHAAISEHDTARRTRRPAGIPRPYRCPRAPARTLDTGGAGRAGAYHRGIDVPVIDLSSAASGDDIDRACRSAGFFALAGHGLRRERREELLESFRRLFALPEEAKARVSLAAGGRAWRGWFPLGGELTSGVADLKEGFYVGREEPGDGRPLHGHNVWPAELPELRDQVLAWMSDMEQLAQRVLGVMAVGLGLDAGWFARDLTAAPTVLFRAFRYPPHPRTPPGGDRWGVAEHTDYGLLTLLAHDGTPGLEVRADGRWISVPHDPELVVCNLGDMLERLTAGRYRSTPHRVRNVADHDRISLPFFLDPRWDARLVPLPSSPVPATTAPDGRWDGADPTTFDGTYGEWLLAKVSRVFPELASEVLPGAAPDARAGSAGPARRAR